ncbi:MAG TPA: gamma-glutamyltransferase, partial [Gammaproteobacteria bacterium]|nr:gamma-glutamyltransferase [Gammaproteobacteria bacterium]
ENGYLIRQADLAVTLEQIAQTQGRAFYSGKIAQQMVDAVKRAGGIWTQKDLDAYQLKEREPIRGQYRGWNITSAAPPSSGGIAL